MKKQPEEEFKSEQMLNKKLSRRDMLRLTGASGLGLLLGGTGAGGLMAARQSAAKTPAASLAPAADTLPFYGAHQAGIITPAQNFLCFAAFDLTTTKLDDVKKLLKSWTEAAAALTSGSLIGNVNDNPNLPPSDTGEADGLTPSRCTLTFGVGPAFLMDDLG